MTKKHTKERFVRSAQVFVTEEEHNGDIIFKCKSLDWRGWPREWRVLDQEELDEYLAQRAEKIATSKVWQDSLKRRGIRSK